MTFISVFLGMLIGGAVLNGRSGFAGVIIGGCFGYILNAISKLRWKVVDVQEDLDLMRSRMRTTERTAPKWQFERGAAAPFAARTESSPPLTTPHQAPEPVVEHAAMATAAATEEPEELLDEVVEEPTAAAPSDAPSAAPSHAASAAPSDAASAAPSGDTPATPSAALRQADQKQSAPQPPPANPYPEPQRQVDDVPDLTEWLGGLLSGENLLVKLGVFILFIGVSFLVKYAAQHGMFPLELRLAGAALGGCTLLGVGWRLREKRPVYAQVVQGGGAGILYIATFAAMRLYHLIPTVAGFSILAATCVSTAVLAILQDAPAMAFLSTAGGFLAPELAAIGTGNPAVLFSYYTVLNAGIIGIAWFRAWRGLNILGFVCTFAVSALWGARFYHPQYFSTVEPFLALFFVGYNVVALLFARRRQTGLHGYLDGTLVFGTPILAFALQAPLVRHFQFGLAWSALAVAVFYLTLATVLLKKGSAKLRPFSEAFLAFGTVFATLAIPLAFDGRWTAAAWSVEGAGLVWAGLRQERLPARCFGYLLLIGSGISFITEVSLPTGPWPVLNGFYCGSLLISGASLFAGYLLARHAERVEPWEAWLEWLLFGWGLTWWYLSGLREIYLHTRPGYIHGAYLAFIAITSGVSALLRRRLLWVLLNAPTFGLLPAMVAFLFYMVLCGVSHPGVNGASLAWPLAFAIWYCMVRDEEQRDEDLPALVHAAPLWLIAIISAWEISWRIGHRDPQLSTWAATAWGVVPAALTLLIAELGERIPWPVARNHRTYLGLGAAPLAICAWVWAVGANVTLPGNSHPLVYLPLLNPLDGATILVLLSILSWYLKVADALPDFACALPHRELRVGYGATIFLWLNATVLRAIHHWAGVPFTSHALFNSSLVQAALSVLWGVTALAMMTVAAKRGLRGIWMGGATLLATVVAKLFLIDLANVGSIERIVSFLAVGVLLLVIGWFAPVPPRNRAGGLS